MRSDKNKKSKGKHAIGSNNSSINTTTATTPAATEESPDKKKGKKKGSKKKLFKRIILILIALGMVMAIAVGIFAGVTISKAPKINPENLYELLNESTIVYDDEGNEIDTVYSESNRDNVEYEDLPKNLINAVVALEDKTFWKHHGFNFIRIIGAIKDKIIHGGAISGTSTITQQLARNLYLKDSRYDHDYRRKIVEAYYTVVLEKQLTKEEILLAYLNTIDFGYHSSGVQAAAQAYFSKDVNDLNLSQCVALAALPQAPTTYQLVEFVNKEDVDKDDKNILKETSDGYWMANEASYDRRMTCLALMKEQGYISEKLYNKASKRNLRDFLKPNYNMSSSKSAYFADYVISEVIDDLMEEKGWDYDTAYTKVYNGGLKIHSTLDSTAQNVIEEEFEDNSNFPDIYTTKDSEGNILNTYGGVALYDYDNYFDKNGRMNFSSKEAKKRSDGSVVLKAGKRLNFYYTEVQGEVDYSIEFKPMYLYDEEGQLCSINGGYVNIPQNYKTMNKNGNIVISADFFKDENYEGYFKFKKDGSISLTSKGYTLEQKVVQPQAAMAIVENSTGYIKALVGGRKTTGRQLHNRATSPRQPGSSIKPLGVYSAALQQSAEEAQNGSKHKFVNYKIDKQGAKYWGNYMTPSSIVIDEPTTINGKKWPSNAGGGNVGPVTMRTALQQSLNTCAVKILMQVGTDYSMDLVEKYGISTLVTEGETNDNNLAALALGGMSRGVTPLDMASAYTTFPNNGVRYETTAYTKVVDNEGNVIINKTKSKKHRVLDSGVAWIMTDMLKSVVTSGLGWPAAISGVQSGGKTGTTDNQVDIWFDGFTPNYSAALWIGNDQNFELTSSSVYAARLWGRIMDQIPAAKKGSYKSAPSNVIHSKDYCISGTQGGTVDVKDLKKTIKICTDTNYLATPGCTHVKKVNAYTEEDKLPKYYCYKHNTNPDKYPISPDETLVVQKPEKQESSDDDNKTDDQDNTPDDNKDSNLPESGDDDDDDDGEAGDGDNDDAPSLDE